MARQNQTEILSILPRSRPRQGRNPKSPVATVVQVDPQVLTDIYEQLDQIKGKLQEQPPAKLRGLSVKEAASLLGTEKPVIYKMIKQNKIPHFWVGRFPRIPEDVVDQMCQQQEEVEHVQQ